MEYAYIFEEYSLLIFWAILGSILGYIAFTDLPKDPPTVRIKQCIKSILLGTFISLPLFTYLIEYTSMSAKLCFMLSGVGALGIPDILMKHYSIITKSIINRVFGKDINGNSNE